jgi:hypothetical protein
MWDTLTLFHNPPTAGFGENKTPGQRKNLWYNKTLTSKAFRCPKIIPTGE